MRFIQGKDREQTTLFPAAIDDYVSQDNPVRFIEAYVNSLDLVELDFQNAEPKDLGRKPYNPSDLLKLYIYGYLNRIRSSRMLEKETHKNTEVMWLLCMLRPDFKTIADFRKDNTKAIKAVSRKFILLCRDLNLFGLELFAIDGSKFSAVNHSHKAYTKNKIQKAIQKIDKSLEKYLKSLEHLDQKESNINKSSELEIREKIDRLTKSKKKFKNLKNQMEITGQKQITLTDPESRVMRTGRQGNDVCYNVQIAVDSKHHLIAEFDVTNDQNDLHQLNNMTSRVKELLQLQNFKTVADLGYFEKNEIKKCHKNQIECYIPESEKSQNYRLGLFTNKDFQYDPEHDLYHCPAGNKLIYQRIRDHSNKKEKVYTTPACRSCTMISKCTRSKRERVIYRWEHQDIIEQMNSRVKENPDIINKRKTMVEHPFGTMKHTWGYGSFLCKGLKMVKTETSFTILAYNIKRVLNIIGIKELLEILAANLKKYFNFQFLKTFRLLSNSI